MKSMLALLIALAPGLAAAETHVVCPVSSTAAYEFSFDETTRSTKGVPLRLPTGDQITGGRIFAGAAGYYLFVVQPKGSLKKELTVRFNRHTWQASFETPADLDMEDPYVDSYACRPRA